MHLFSPMALLGLMMSLAAAFDVTLYLPAKPNPFSLPPTTHATLTSLHKHHSAPLSSVNTFVFRNVTPDSYLVDVHSTAEAFRPLRLDVGVDGGVSAWETYRGNEWGNRGEALTVREGSAGKGVEVKAIGAKHYFTERPKFSILTILKNPMILMGIVSMVLFVAMPKMMENMDPETKAEFEAQQKSNPLLGGGGGGQAAENPLQNFDMAAWMAGSGKKDGSKPPGAKNQGGGGVTR